MYIIIKKYKTFRDKLAKSVQNLYIETTNYILLEGINEDLKTELLVAKRQQIIDIHKKSSEK